MNRSPLRRGLTTFVACVGLAALTACGTRLTDPQIKAGQEGLVNGSSQGAGDGTGGISVLGNGSSVGGTTGGGTTGGGTTGGGTTGGGTTRGGTTGGGTSGGGATGGGTISGSRTGTGGGTTSGSRTGSSGGTSGASGSGTTSGGTASGGGSQPTAAACTTAGPPIVIGQTGAFSGLVGQSTANMRLGLAVWAKYINDHGGVGCHQIQLFQEDDGSDPSKGAANINDLVKNKHAVAIVGLDQPITIASGRSAAAQNGVPVVGGDLTPTDWTEDPTLFSQGGGAIYVYTGAVREAIKATGKTNVGEIYCIEASICGVINSNWGAMVKNAGGTGGWSQSASLTAPDFTSQCQSAKNAGVQVLAVWMDGSAMQRIAKSCNSIGYKPRLVTAGIASSPNALNDPNVKSLGVIIASNEVAFLGTGTDALTTFHNAFKTYSGSDAPDQSAMKGWTSGMLFKAAIEALGSAGRSQAITPALVKQGLYKLHGETLGGLVPALTFASGQPSPNINCYSVVSNTSSGLATLSGNKLFCR